MKNPFMEPTKLFWPSRGVRYGIFEKAQKIKFQKLMWMNSMTKSRIPDIF